jgi:tRNA-dihydrouridine synthase B
MEQAAHIAAAQEPDLIDINCGCWVKNVALRGAGAGLLKDLPRMREVVARVVRSTHLPVTVKTRLGWDAESIRIVEVAQMLEDLGVQALTVHCRTRAQGHKGSVDYSWIPRIKTAVSMPVVLNGDVTTPADVERAFAQTGCDAVMIGRSAIQHPWIFRETRHYLETGEQVPEPTLKQRVELCLQHLQLAVEHKGQRQGLIDMRRHYAGYFRGLPGTAQLRAELARYQDLEPLQERLQELHESDRAASIAA